MKRVQFFSFLSCLLSTVILIDAAANSKQDNIGLSETIISTLRSKIQLASRTLIGHTEQVNTVDFSPNGNLVASGSWDNTVRIWNTRTGNCLHVLSGHTSGVTSVVFNPNGRTIASASWDDTIRIWDVESGECLHVVTPDTYGVLSLAYSSDGRILASGSQNGNITIINAYSGNILNWFKCHAYGINALAFKHNSLMLVSGARDGKVSLSNLITKMNEKNLHGYSNWLGSVTLGSDDRTVAFPKGADVRIFDMQTGELKNVLEGHAGWISSVAYNLQKTLLASGSFDHTVRLWDTQTGECTSTLEGHTNWVSSVAFGPFGKMLVSGSRDKTVRIWFDPFRDINAIDDPEELQLLHAAAHDWQNDRPHKIDAHRQPFLRLITRFSYLNDTRLFDQHAPQAELHISEKKAPDFDSLIEADEADLAEDAPGVILPPKMRK